MLISYTLFGKKGLYILVPMAMIAANITGPMVISTFGMEAAVGSVFIGSTFLTTDIINENHGVDDAKKAIWLGFTGLMVFTIVMGIVTFFTPAESDWATPHIRALFSIMPRISFASAVTFLVSGYFDVKVYDFIRRLLPANKYLPVRNIGSTVLSQSIDSSLFNILALAGMFSPMTLVSMTVMTLIWDYTIAILDTPFMIIAKKIAKKRGHFEEPPEEYKGDVNKEVIKDIKGVIN